MAVQLAHECLAEAHDLRVAATSRVEIGATLAAAQHERRDAGILQDLLKAQELQDGQVHGRVEAQAAFVRPEGLVELHSETTVHVLLAFIIHPHHSEHDGTIWLAQALEYGHQLRTFREQRLQRLHDFANRLVELGLVRISLPQPI